MSLENTQALSPSQTTALKILQGSENVFLTGAAGSGKSFLIRRFLHASSRPYPVLASTGSAAILVGGRTFHSFFGLGILEGGVEATIERAVKNKRLSKRLRNTEGVILDEVSMISGPTLRTAESIARLVRGDPRPWGGIRIIAVGDFAQLPPVNPYSNKKEWAFLEETWTTSDFQPVLLTEIMRTEDLPFLKILNHVREGVVNSEVSDFLNSRLQKKDFIFEGTRMLARRDEVENYNLTQLEKIDGPAQSFPTSYKGKDTEIEKFKKNAPIAEIIQLKKGALVMIRQNDPEGRWVNGSLGTIDKMETGALSIRLSTGRTVKIEPSEFTLLDAEGNTMATATNFPVALAWALTIHKAQGTTLDRVWVNIARLWEPGQAYVALSRARSSEGLFIESWSPRSIVADPQVKDFHAQLKTAEANFVPKNLSLF